MRYLEEKWRPRDLDDFTVSGGSQQRKLRIKLTNEVTIADKSFKLVKAQNEMRRIKTEERQALKAAEEEARKRKAAMEAQKFLQIGKAE